MTLWSFGRIVLVESSNYLIRLWLPAYWAIIWLQFGSHGNLLVWENVLVGQHGHCSPYFDLTRTSCTFSLSVFSYLCFAPHPTWISWVISEVRFAFCQYSKLHCLISQSFILIPMLKSQLLMNFICSFDICTWSAEFWWRKSENNCWIYGYWPQLSPQDCLENIMFLIALSLKNSTVICLNLLYCCQISNSPIPLLSSIQKMKGIQRGYGHLPTRKHISLLHLYESYLSSFLLQRGNSITSYLRPIQ